jgi:hypothetical protein
MGGGFDGRRGHEAKKGEAMIVEKRPLGVSLMAVLYFVGAGFYVVLLGLAVAAPATLPSLLSALSPQGSGLPPQPWANAGDLFHRHGSSGWLTWVWDVDTEELVPPSHGYNYGALVDRGLGFSGPDSKPYQSGYPMVESVEDWSVLAGVVVSVET